MSVSPIKLLRQMEHAVRKAGVSLPQETVIAEQWVGLAFKVGRYQVVTAMDHVREVVPCVPLTSVPRTRPWMRGIANVRGSLLTVVDLQAYLGMDPVSIDQYSRLLVINNEALMGCLLVGRLQGLRHFDPVEDRCEAGYVDGNIATYVNGAVRKENERWLVLDIDRLIEDRQFRRVAA